MGEARIKERQLNVQVTKNELVYNVKSAYYQLNYLLALNMQLQSQDTVYQNFLKAAQLRYETGESTLLESKTAETQLNEIRNTIQKNKGDILIYQRQLQILLNSSQPVIISDATIEKESINALLNRQDSINSPY